MRGALLLLIAFPCLAVETAEEIMRKVAVNQDRAQEQRRNFRYQQNLLVRIHRANGKLAREELRFYEVTPSGTGTTKKLVHFAGKMVKGRREITFDKPDFRGSGLDIDGEIANGFAEDLGDHQQSGCQSPDDSRHVRICSGDDSKTRDGVDKDIFVLSSKSQPHYAFTLQGIETYHGHQVYNIHFAPRKKGEEDADWAGEALIDCEAYQPVLVTTHLAWGIPVAVKILLGTDVRHLGFKVTYEKFGDGEGVWFPVTYGGELQLRAVFFYARRISVSLRNEGFQRAAVWSQIEFEQP